MNKTNLVILVDRQKAIFFTLRNGSVGDVEKFIDGHVPQRVKHGNNTWDAQDKINRHIDDHLRRHLELVSKKAVEYVGRHPIGWVIIGSHKTLFSRIRRYLSPSLSHKIKGEFVSELKAPFNEILKRAVSQSTKMEAINL